MIRHNRATAAVFGRCFLALISVFALQRNLPAAPMVYTGLVVTDVRVGTTLLHNASLKITFEGDPDNIIPVVMPGSPTQIPSQECVGTNSFFYLTKGVARMEIEFRGRSRTARLNDGQVFVAVDECNGGIGFGSFVGPSGLEPAYPLALTLGTAEWAAITYSSPLKRALSTTGPAWSCIGYPPAGDDALPGTADGFCTSPDTYPLKSDIGNIFVYQPYFEYDGPGNTNGLASNHSGSTNRGAFLVRPKAHDTFATPGASESVRGSRVVYTLQTVADGSLGGHVFRQALVTFQMISDAHSVTSQPSSVDVTRPVYENRAGYATVTVDDGGNVIVGEFEPGEVYVRYDTGAGVAGFGSKISPTYPVALGCSNAAYPSESKYSVDCLQGDWWTYHSILDDFEIFHAGTLGQLSSPGDPSPAVAALPQSLSQNTLLTGTAHTCAGVYTIGSSTLDDYFPGDLGVCGEPAPHGLRTSKGKLFLQDLEGGTLNLGNVPIVINQDTGAGGGWDFANSGFLHVEVLKGDD
jgi:hypothetical protein